MKTINATLITLIEEGKADEAIIKFLKEQYESHSTGRVLLKYEDKEFYCVYDSADMRGGDKKATGEDTIIYKETACKGYDSLPRESFIKDYANDFEGIMNHEACQIAKNKNETVTDAIENYIDADIDSKLDEFKEHIIENLEEWSE